MTQSPSPEPHIRDARKVLVLGGYGLIGYGIVNRLLMEGHRVTGLGRDQTSAQQVLPDIPWIIQDISALQSAADWRNILRGFSAVVNASGALQDGPDDDLEALHHHAIAALAGACAEADIQLIQVSAAGAEPDASTIFMTSKARGDQAIRESCAAYQIFRPGLVIAPHAYGGSAMLRMLAAVPWVQPIAVPDAQIQTVSLDHIADTICAAVRGHIPNGFEADLLEPTPQPLRSVIAEMRHWLGFAAAKRTLILPGFGVRILCTGADWLARLGWRTPLRSTAFRVLADGVRGTAVDLSGFGVPPATALPQTLAQMPARTEDRLYARLLLLTPVIVICLCLFWLASGLVGLMRITQAAEILQTAGWSPQMALLSVGFWSCVDIAIGIGFAIRRYARIACGAAIAVGLFYLVASSLTVPDLWLDPLGPLVKTIPALILTLIARALLENR